MSNSESFLSATLLNNNLVEQIAIEQNLPPKTNRIGGGSRPSISANGRYVAFVSNASETNYQWDIFVYDRQTRITEKVNVASDGTQANDDSWNLSISSDGRYVAFASSANNLVPEDTNGKWDIFVRDRQTGTTERVSVASDGTQANDGSWNVSISADGRYVAFQSYASNLVSGDTNNQGDIFVRDRQTGVTERVSVASDGTQAKYDSWHSSPSISPQSISSDGRYVAFKSCARNLVPGDTNGLEDIFVRDRQTGVTERVSVAADGTQAKYDSWQLSTSMSGLSMSADGRYVVFGTWASNLTPDDKNDRWDLFVRDRQTGTTERINAAFEYSAKPPRDDTWDQSTSISADGRYVAFYSSASSLVPKDKNELEDVFVYDRQTGVNERISVASDGTPGNYGSAYPSMSADGRYVAFDSWANNLVPEGDRGIFVRDRGTSFSAPDSSKNIIEGTPEKDFLLGTPNSDRIYGFAGDDTLIGRAGDDLLYGGVGSDTLFGNNGNDSLFGGDGRDSLFGNSGDDFLDGGAGDDWLTGGSGADQFVLREGGGLNTIVDYLDGVDSFLLDGGLTFEKLTISQGAGKTLISLTQTKEDLAVLIGVEANSIGAEDFTILG